MTDDPMINFRTKTALVALACAFLTASCGGFKNTKLDPDAYDVDLKQGSPRALAARNGGLFDAFKGNSDAGVKVNRYLWTAALDVLDFLPVQSADPFTGVITTGYGRPPGGGSAYRATILISDPALDARSLNVALQTQRGPVSTGTQRAVEDAILARARQIRVNAEKF